MVELQLYQILVTRWEKITGKLTTKIGKNEKGLRLLHTELLLCCARQMSVSVKEGSKLFSIFYSACEGSREGFARIAATIDMESFLKMSSYFTHSHFDNH